MILSGRKTGIIIIIKLMLYLHYLKELFTSKCQFCHDACIVPSMNDNVFVYKLFCSYTFIKSIQWLQKRIPDKTGIFVRKKDRPRLRRMNESTDKGTQLRVSTDGR